MLRRESGIRRPAHENIGKMHWRLGITVEAEKSFKEDLKLNALNSNNNKTIIWI